MRHPKTTRYQYVSMHVGTIYTSSKRCVVTHGFRMCRGLIDLAAVSLHMCPLESLCNWHVLKMVSKQEHAAAYVSSQNLTGTESPETGQKT